MHSDIIFAKSITHVPRRLWFFVLAPRQCYVSQRVFVRAGELS